MLPRLKHFRLVPPLFELERITLAWIDSGILIVDRVCGCSFPGIRTPKRESFPPLEEVCLECPSFRGIERTPE